MNNVEYNMLKLKNKFFHNKDYIVEKYKELGMTIGEDVHIFSNIITSEPYLIYIGSGTTISTNVSLLTHDASIGALVGRERYSDLCGKIVIGNNCFIGNNSIILYGVTLGDNVIVAAGSVVTKSYDSGNVILAGNPAKCIGTVSEFINKNQSKFYSLHNCDIEERKKRILCEVEKLIIRKVGDTTNV